MHILLLLISALIIPTAASAIPVTGVSGQITDAKTGEPMPYVSVVFLGSQIGTLSDEDGIFYIENTQGFNTLSVSMLGYETYILPVKANTLTENVKIQLSPDAYNLQAVVVKPKRGRDAAYRKKGNPAVELVENVIKHKKDNRVESREHYKVDTYEKLIMALDQFDFDFDSSRFWRNFKFIEKYVDTAQFKSTPVLTVSLRETLADRYYQDRPRREKTYVRAKRMQGLDDVLDKEGMATNLDAMFTRADIFDDDMEVMLNRFVSPLSSSMATNYYKYYISDTLMVDGLQCIDLTFVPFNSESYSFTGHLYVVNDSTYAVKKYSLNVPAHINLNFVSNLAIEENYERLDNGLWAPVEKNTFTRFYIFKKMRQLYAHQKVLYGKYDFETPYPDSLFTAGTDEAQAENARSFTKPEWVYMRPVPLSTKESVIDSLIVEIKRIPRVNTIVKAGETLISNYIPTTSERKNSYWDFGPFTNMLSYNTLEGVRLRIGGMTTSRLNNRNFLVGYAAFGTRDLRLKYNATFVHSFNDKDWHPYESLRNNLSFTAAYDADVPGQSFALLDRDHILMSSFSDKPYQYVRKFQLKYEKEWASRISIETAASWENNEAAGLLSYKRMGGSGALESVKSFNSWEWYGTLRFAPGEPLSVSRMGKNNVFNLAKDAPVVSLTHRMGYFDNQYFYNRTDIVAEKRFWLSSFGHIDASFQTGIVWNKVPLPKLYIPQTSQSFLLSPNAFNMMRPMEFVMDQYAALFATYYLKGWILNRIPLINRLKLREVVSFNALVGTLSQDNNPLYGTPGLYALPDHTRLMTRTPYMEFTVGLENIFKFIRIDYVRRLTYTEGLPSAQKNGIKFTFRFTL